MGKWKKCLLMTNCSSLFCFGNILNVIAMCVKSFYKKEETEMTDMELIKNWGTIRTEFEAMERMSCVPVGIRKVKTDHIFGGEVGPLEPRDGGKEQCRLSGRGG